MHGKKLAELDRAPNGFNTIRLICAVLVIVSHAFELTGQTEPLKALSGETIGNLCVAAFFVISGFLIPASLDRGSLGRYVNRRAMRIMPGLFVAVLVSMFVFGLVFTTLAPAQFLSAPGTWSFLGNAVFAPVGYALPGVFTDQPVPAVNGSLWSLKFEVACYVLVVAAACFGRWRKPAVVASFIASFAVAALLRDRSGFGVYYVQMLAGLFRFFGAGMILYLFRDRISVNRSYAWIALALVIASAFTPFFVDVCAIAGSYALVAYAYLAGPRFRAATERGDISYGVYVYAFPIQQALVPISLAALGVSLAPLVNALMTLPFVIAIATASWLYIEKPSLRHRRKPKFAASPG